MRNEPAPCRDCGTPLEMQPQVINDVCGDCITEGCCPRREDEVHCEDWWDGDAPCCACGHNGTGRRIEQLDAACEHVRAEHETP